ncbi:MAG: type 11 methyltransferase [Verrucomicrobiales bacterium]|nr:type 11 methyltransferase [Verrucomicrobiales bacterium]
MELNSVQEAAEQQFSRQSHKYGRGHILENIQDVEKGVEGIPIRKGDSALDVATGGGHTGIFFARQGLDVTLADISSSMLEKASSLAAEQGLKVKTRQHSAEELPYPSDSFDWVTCRVAGHHFSSPQKFVFESGRILKPGGHLLIIDGTVKDKIPIAEEWIHQVEKLRDPSHNRFRRPSEWAAWCEAAGLKVLKCETNPFKQPDLEWYFETADTSLENRAKVKELVSTVPSQAAEAFGLALEAGKTIWWWHRLTLVAEKTA